MILYIYIFIINLIEHTTTIIKHFKLHINFITQRFISVLKCYIMWPQTRKLKVGQLSFVGFTLHDIPKTAYWSSLIKPEPNPESCEGCPACKKLRKRARRGINETLHRVKNKEIKRLQTKLVQMFVTHHFRVLNAAYLERRWSSLCALRISAPAHTISGPKQRITVSPAFKPWQQKKFWCN